MLESNHETNRDACVVADRNDHLGAEMLLTYWVNARLDNGQRADHSYHAQLSASRLPGG
jgi:hypothetical protein